MGKYEKGILGPFNGKVGTVIGSQWKGITYMRSLPRKSNKAATQKQLDVQNKFLQVINFLKPISGLIVDGYQNIKGSLTPFNYAVSYHLKNAISGVSPNFTINLNKVVISRGELNGLTDATVASDAANTLHFSWDALSLMGLAKTDDKVSALIFEETSGSGFTFQESALRSAGEFLAALPASFSGQTVNCWITVKSNDNKLISTSAYLGQVVVQ
ncbi:MAG: hypothetical protein KKE39_02720 [Bacteroidetes bacterium]|nr:hypothetical protein [Bacteroidota bacterium]MBU1372245.1 hypothetical protein [Bacteroidota bacterium]MBU1484496.1 hypothetical protein [Bacteroidota bacterium]MBU1759716.1 hypothetical protein [Bacteroidota bacterium]MBU2045655.1 hypothetical protein [Bacteroidota bacterium]